MVHSFAVLLLIFLPFFDEMWFLTAGPRVRIPVTFAEFSEMKELPVYLREAPLAVTTVVGFFDILTVSIRRS